MNCTQMNCTHPVLYVKDDGFYCRNCGAFLRFPTKEEIFPEGKTIVLPIPKVERAETPKKGG